MWKRPVAIPSGVHSSELSSGVVFHIKYRVPSICTMLLWLWLLNVSDMSNIFTRHKPGIIFSTIFTDKACYFLRGCLPFSLTFEALHWQSVDIYLSQRCTGSFTHVCYQYGGTSGDWLISYLNIDREPSSSDGCIVSKPVHDLEYCLLCSWSYSSNIWSIQITMNRILEG